MNAKGRSALKGYNGGLEDEETMFLGSKHVVSTYLATSELVGMLAGLRPS